MWQFLARTFAFFGFALLVACGIELFLFVQMKDRRAHVHEDWLDMHGLEADVILLGNSRTAGHAIPSIIEEGTGLKVYNLAYDGYTAQMGAYRLDYLLKHAKKKPSIVLLQTDLTFCQGDAIQDNYPMKDGVLRYFFLDQIGINCYFRNYSNWREADTFIPLLRYKGYPLMFFKHLFRWNRWDKRSEQGFWHTDKQVGFELETLPSSKDVSLSLAGIDSVCKANQIELVGLIPPSPQASLSPNHAALQASLNGSKIWDFSLLFVEKETERFYDIYHFDSQGAKDYSQKLNSKLLLFLKEE